MDSDDAPLLTIAFAAPVVEWRGPAPFFFAVLPERVVPAVRDAARSASYGWGVIPVAARIGAVDFTTSLFPRDGGYLLPLKDKVRRALGTVPGDDVTVEMRVA